MAMELLGAAVEVVSVAAARAAGGWRRRCEDGLPHALTRLQRALRMCWRSEMTCILCVRTTRIREGCGRSTTDFVGASKEPGKAHAAHDATASSKAHQRGLL